MKSGPTPPLQDDPLVELVDSSGNRIGIKSKLQVHQPPGFLHRAFSVFLLDDSGNLLLQQRAWGKYHSGGLWTNTCCGHPLPGERPQAAAERRLAFELGARVTSDGLVPAGVVSYRVEDPVSGLIEYELDHLFVGRVPAVLDPVADEVAGLALVPIADLRRDGRVYSAWFDVVLEAARPILATWMDQRTARAVAR